MTFQYEHYRQSADAVAQKLNGFRPGWLLILGSGLGFLADKVEQAITIPYSEIPHFPVSTAPGHAGQFVAGMLAGRPVLAMQGRFHVYEGYSAEQVAYPVRVAHLLGTHSMIVTNASGGINTGYRPGDLMLISDFIKPGYLSPLTGPNLDEFGPRFCDMSRVFDPEYRAQVRNLAQKSSQRLQEGVYLYTTGPQFETPAEIRAYRTLGADAVGMSTVPECIAANHCSIRILGISLITNMAAGILDQPLSGEEVIEMAEQSKGPFSQIIVDFLKKSDI